MHRFLLVITLLLGFTSPTATQEPPKVTTLFSRDLSDIPGKEGTMLIVEYPPGAADPVHRHAANAPCIDDALWIYAQMARWGQLRPSAALQSRAARVFRRDLYERYVGAAPEPSDQRAYDDVAFTPDDIEGYLQRFSLRTPFVDPSSADR